MCGIAGAWNVDGASYLVSLMLKAMQHRGQEAAGIISAHGGRLHEHLGFGLADEVFADVSFHDALPGRSAIGHLRYATSGDSDSSACIQPMLATVHGREVAVAHNGNLTNALALYEKLEAEGSIFRSTSDTELFLHLLAKEEGKTFVELLARALARVRGAYALLIQTAESLVAAMDPYGFRPLSVGRHRGGWVFASETCAFDLLQATDVQMLAPGEVLELSADTLTRTTYAHRPTRRHCSFEQIYFSRPDSLVFGRSVHEVRDRLGRLLARSVPRRPDLVTAVPDSSNAMALACAEALGVPFRFALIRSHYAGRTFITPKQTAREVGVRMKLNAVRSLVDGRSIAVVDDSLVRGTTAGKVVRLLRDAGAREVHLCLASPPVIHPCFWGIDTPERRELIAADRSIDEIRSMIGADTLTYLSHQDLWLALYPTAADYCYTCFTGNPPTDEPLPPARLLRHVPRPSP